MSEVHNAGKKVKKKNYSDKRLVLINDHLNTNNKKVSKINYIKSKPFLFTRFNYYLSICTAN